jgi:hypothetical protein
MKTALVYVVFYPYDLLWLFRTSKYIRTIPLVSLAILMPKGTPKLRFRTPVGEEGANRGIFIN